MTCTRSPEKQSWRWCPGLGAHPRAGLRPSPRSAGHVPSCMFWTRLASSNSVPLRTPAPGPLHKRSPIRDTFLVTLLGCGVWMRADVSLCLGGRVVTRCVS